jgi:quinolinate synthase
LKKEKNAYILAHNYAPRDIQDVADAVGDSLYLAQKGAESDAELLLEASVLFMNEILAIMKKPGQRVLAPDLGALCSLAAHADGDKIRRWKSEHPDGIVISYVNTYLDVKAESDYCCASANAARVILHVLEHSNADQPILFLPDIYLGFYAAKLLEQKEQSVDRLWLMMGACHGTTGYVPIMLSSSASAIPMPLWWFIQNAAAPARACARWRRVRHRRI